MSDTICVVPIPGPQGPAGAAGTNGTNGVSAFTTTTASFVMPAEGANVTISVVTSAPFDAGQIIYIEVGGAKGYFEVVSAPTATSLTITNLENTASSLYLINSAPATSFATGASVQPGGLQGPSGTVAAGSLLAANNLSDVANPATSRTNLGLGTSATRTAGNADTNLPFVNDAAGLTNGEFLRATATGIESVAAATARTGLGLGTVSTLTSGVANGNVAPIDDAAFTSGEVVFATATGLETVADATTRSRLDLHRAPQDILIYQHQLAAGTNAGTFTSGSWATVPLTTEVADTGNHGSIAANTVTLATGVYRVRWRVCGYQVGLYQSRLFNVTTAGIVGLGSNAKSAAADAVQTESHGEGRITIAAATEDIRIEAQCETTGTNTGFGIANAFGGTQVYAALWLEKEVG